MKLNLGCGKKKLEGYVNADIDESANPDAVIDFDKELPYKDGSIDEVMMQHSLEHCKDIGYTFKEVMRVLSPRGVFRFVVPIKDVSPTHNYFFSIRKGYNINIDTPSIWKFLMGVFHPNEFEVSIVKR